MDQELAAVETTHSPHLAHHFGTMEQQFDSAKLGMWLFLATEVLLFGGLFCAYTIYRSQHQDIFEWGSHFLDRRLGGLNTIILISSSLTMALAVRAAQLGRRSQLIVLLFLTLLGACGFLVVKFFEYRPKVEHGLLWGTNFRPDPAYVLAHFGGGDHGEGAMAVGAPAEEKKKTGDAESGKKIASETCASCHGADLHGMPRNGLDLTKSAFVAEKSDEELLVFLRAGRQSFEPANTTGVAMPPRGGNPLLNDDKLLDVITYLRIVQKLEKEKPATAPTPDAALASSAAEAPDSAAAALVVAGWLLPEPPPGPPGLVHAGVAPIAMDSHAPPNAHHFFAIYFMMTGLHGLHVLFGMIVIGWMLLRSMRNEFSPAYYAPIDITGLYWHLVDLIWIFLFPLLYLI